jgi:5'-3' exonuclease
MTGKYTLIFDGNFFLHKTYFIGQKIKFKNGKGNAFDFIQDPEGDKNLLLWKLAIDFASEVRRFEGVINRIVYTIDSSSWRKKFLDSDYKANRVKSSDIDWGGIYDTHTEFAKALESMGITVSRIYGAEADDLIFGWSSFLNQQGQNAIIISGDNDLLQLVNMDKSSDANTLYYNKFDKNMHSFPGFESWLNQENLSTTNDIFNMPIDILTNTKKSLRDIIKSNRMPINEVNTNEFIFKKVLVGDAGDNVPPLYSYTKETKAGPRTYRVTDRQANLILDKFKSERIHVNQSHFFNEELITRIAELATEVIGIPDNLESTIEKWKLNRDLVYLHKSCIPQEINTSMFEHIEKEWKSVMNGTKINEIMNKDLILENTTYTKEATTSFSEPSIMKVTTNQKTSNVNIKKDDDKSTGFSNDFWDDLIK